MAEPQPRTGGSAGRWQADFPLSAYSTIRSGLKTETSTPQLAFQQALGCDGWFTARVTTCGELDAAMTKAESCGTGVYIEVVTDKYVAPPLPMKLHESTKA